MVQRKLVIFHRRVQQTMESHRLEVIGKHLLESIESFSPNQVHGASGPSQKHDDDVVIVGAVRCVFQL